METSCSKITHLSDSANSADGVLNSGITEFGTGGTVRNPDRTNTLGRGSAVFDPRGARRPGGGRAHVRLGVGFLQAGVRR
ncbi:hypothetical protein ACFWWS_19990 [Streptomyces sp. NPDC059083]|uniref:hypothetical protein n=1 Tax=unclassified Streptomyces TaxID=2593676 RepID=UPI0036AA37EB